MSLAGLIVPDTLITNEPAAVRDFAAGGPMVTKLVGGMAIDEDGVRKNVYTRRVTEDDLADLRGIEHTTHLFQRWVPKTRECRVIVIGEEITAAAITAAYVDYRTDYDFVITLSDDWLLLELNPTGQYGFVENATGAPLTAQLADLLAGVAP